MAIDLGTQTASRSDGAQPTDTAPLLDLDPELGRGLSRAQRSDAKRELTARMMILRPGDSCRELFRTGLFGALVIEGALVRRVATDRGRSLEVIVAGDLLRPYS